MGLFWDKSCSAADLNKGLEKIIGEFRLMETITLLTIADLKQKVAALTKAVAAQTSLDRSVAMLVSSQVATMRELRDKIAALSAGAVTQDDISELSGDVAMAAQALAEGTAQLAAAVPVNTEFADLPVPAPMLAPVSIVPSGVTTDPWPHPAPTPAPTPAGPESSAKPAE